MSAHLGVAVTALVDGELSHARREEVLAHLLHCAPCRAEADEVRRYKAAVRQTEAPPVPFDLTARLLAATVDIPQQQQPVQVRRLQPQRVVLPTPRAPRRTARRTVVRRSATAGALVVLGLGGALVVSGPPPRGPLAPVDPTSSRFMIDHATTTGEIPFTETDLVSVSVSSSRSVR